MTVSRVDLRITSEAASTVIDVRWASWMVTRSNSRTARRRDGQQLAFRVSPYWRAWVRRLMLPASTTVDRSSCLAGSSQCENWELQAPSRQYIGLESSRRTVSSTLRRAEAAARRACRYQPLKEFDMKRRTFLQAGAMGVAGLSTPTGSGSLRVERTANGARGSRRIRDPFAQTVLGGLRCRLR